LKIVRPETVIRWHRAGFRAYWRWKSRPRSGRPKTPLEIRQVIREISLANPLWDAPARGGRAAARQDAGRRRGACPSSTPCTAHPHAMAQDANYVPWRRALCSAGGDDVVREQRHRLHLRSGGSLDLRPRRNVRCSIHHRTGAAKSKVPRRIASQPAKPLLINHIARWVF